MRWLAVIALFWAGVAGAQHVDTANVPGAAMYGFHSDSAQKAEPSLPWISEYAQPPIYGEWWQEIAKCQGLEIDSVTASTVKFYYVNAWDFVNVDSAGKFDPLRYFALSYMDAGQTYVSVGLIYNKSIVQHEMYHFILLQNGLPHSHSPENRAAFERCGLHEEYNNSIYSKALKP